MNTAVVLETSNFYFVIQASGTKYIIIHIHTNTHTYYRMSCVITCEYLCPCSKLSTSLHTYNAIFLIILSCLLLIKVQ